MMGDAPAGRTSPALVVYAWTVVAATLSLIFLGGMVTTKGAGLAVPDWPLSFGQINPPGWWKVESVMLEHGHRLVASGIGLLTTGLAVALWTTEKRRWLRWLGVAAFLGVVFQGVLGGLRVTRLSIELAMVHACVAQAFLCLLIVIAWALGRGMREGRLAPIRGITPRLGSGLAWGLVGAIYLQLILGAVMRHRGAGLAIPDFPLSYGKVIPPFESFEIAIHFAHRAGAVLVALLACFVAGGIFLKHGRREPLVLRASALVLLVAFQIALGAHIIWLGRPPVTTTLHVLTGALTLSVALAIALRMTWPPAPAREREPEEAVALEEVTP